MENTIVTFETAKLAKEKGLDIRGLMFYVTNTCGEYPWQKEGALVDEADHLDETGYSNHKVSMPFQLFAPTQSLLQKWLRDVYKINVSPCLDDRYRSKWIFELVFMEGNKLHSLLCNKFYYNPKYNSYEEALESGLIESLKLLTPNQ